MRDLLPYVKDFGKRINVFADFAGQCIGIDVLTVIYRAVKTDETAQLLLEGRKEDAWRDCESSVLDLCFKFCRHGIRPVVVFDGAPLPAKEATRLKRRNERERAKQELDLELAKPQDQRYTKYVSPSVLMSCRNQEILLRLCKASIAPEDTWLDSLYNRLRLEGISTITAAFEADAQLAFMSMHKYIDAVLTVDGDLLVYGARNIIIDFDRSSGDALLLPDPCIASSWGIGDSANSFFTASRKWGLLGLLHMFAVFTGCDYAEGVPGIGKVHVIELFSAAALKRPQGTVENRPPPFAAVKTAVEYVMRQHSSIQSQWTKKSYTWDSLELDYARVTSVYSTQVIYDLDSRRFRPLNFCTDAALSADDVPPTTSGWLLRDVGNVSCSVYQVDDATDAPVETATDPSEITIPFHEAHALGFVAEYRLSVAGALEILRLRRLLPIGKYQDLRETAPRRLIPSMVTGAVLALSDVTRALAEAREHAAAGRAATSSILTKEAMSLFLTTRNYHGFSGDTWMQLAEKVQKRLDLELQYAQSNPDFDPTLDRRGGDTPGMIRDPSGACLITILLSKGIVSRGDFPQFDEALVAPDMADGWITDLTTIQSTSPYLLYSVVKSHFKNLITESATSPPRVFERGYQHIRNLRKLEGFKFHPSPLGATQTDVVAFSMLCHASMVDTYYRVTALCKVDMHSATALKPITDILRIYCEPSITTPSKMHVCQASGYTAKDGDKSAFYACCTHSSALIHALLNLNRPAELASEIEGVPTASACVWNHPSGNGKSALPADRPTYEVVAMVQDMGVKYPAGSGLASHKGATPVADPATLGAAATAPMQPQPRALYNPIPPKLRHLNSRNSPARVANRAILEKCLSTAHTARADKVWKKANLDDSDLELREVASLHDPDRVVPAPSTIAARAISRTDASPPDLIARTRPKSPDLLQMTSPLFEQILRPGPACVDVSTENENQDGQQTGSKPFRVRYWCVCDMCDANCDSGYLTIPRNMGEEAALNLVKTLPGGFYSDRNRIVSTAEREEKIAGLRNTASKAKYRISKCHFSERQLTPHCRRPQDSVLKPDACADVPLADVRKAAKAHNDLVYWNWRAKHGVTEVGLGHPTPSAWSARSRPSSHASQSSAEAEDADSFALHSVENLIPSNPQTQPGSPYISPKRQRIAEPTVAKLQEEVVKLREENDSLARKLNSCRDDLRIAEREVVDLRDRMTSVLPAIHHQVLQDLKQMNIAYAALFQEFSELKREHERLQQDIKSGGLGFTPFSYDLVTDPRNRHRFTDAWFRIWTGFFDIESFKAWMACINSDQLCESVVMYAPVAHGSALQPAAGLYVPGTMWMCRETSSPPQVETQDGTAGEPQLRQLRFNRIDVLCLVDIATKDDHGHPLTLRMVNITSPGQPPGLVPAGILTPASPASAPADIILATSMNDGGRPRTVSWQTAVLMVLVTLRCGFDQNVSAFLFGMDDSTADRSVTCNIITPVDTSSATVSSLLNGSRGSSPILPTCNSKG